MMTTTLIAITYPIFLRILLEGNLPVQVYPSEFLLTELRSYRNRDYDKKGNIRGVCIEAFTLGFFSSKFPKDGFNCG